MRKVLSGVFDLQHEIGIWLEQECHELSIRFDNDEFLMNVAYLPGTFRKLDELNPQMQGTNRHLAHLADKTTSITRKLEAWERRVKEGKIDSFEDLKSFIKVNGIQYTIIHA